MRWTNIVVGAILLLATGVGVAAAAPAGTPTSGETGIHKIQHVIIIMQENRSFDTYFGTFPGADGFPAKNGQFTVCVPDPATKSCQKPYHDPNDENAGGPHGAANATADINGGKMDGFISQAEKGRKASCAQAANQFNPECTQGLSKSDVMGYHDAREIPNYWTYAEQFVLQDHMFEPNASWSLPAHLFIVSEWSATCSIKGDPMSCVNALQNPQRIPAKTKTKANAKAKKAASPSTATQTPDYAWTDLTYLLHKDNISWGYYVDPGTQPDCDDDAIACAPQKQTAKTPEIWNPLPYFDTVQQDGQLNNIQPQANFFKAAKNGTLPAVSWVIPNGKVSEHPPALVSAGQTYVTGIINAVMESPDWDSSAIFLAWDDWGGFYDQVVPPTVDQNGYGLRVPGLVISPYAKRGYIDHQILSFDAYAKFIEDDFLGGQRIDPKTDGRPDPRPDVRENASILGNLVNDFDFNQAPRPPLILSAHPKPGPASVPGGGIVRATPAASPPAG